MQLQFFGVIRARSRARDCRTERSLATKLDNIRWGRSELHFNKIDEKGFDCLTQLPFSLGPPGHAEKCAQQMNAALVVVRNGTCSVALQRHWPHAVHIVSDWAGIGVATEESAKLEPTTYQKT